MNASQRSRFAILKEDIKFVDSYDLDPVLLFQGTSLELLLWQLINSEWQPKASSAFKFLPNVSTFGGFIYNHSTRR